MEDNKAKMPHNLVMEDRKKLTISGVCDVDSFDEQTITVFTDQGELNVKGRDLHVNRLDIEMGEVSLEGKIVSLCYTDDQPRQTGFFGKVFR